MSDFGAILVIKKSGGFSSADKSLIIDKLKNIIEGGDYSDALENGGFKELVGWNDNDLCSKLTEYYDDEDSEEIREFAEEEDIEEAKEIAEILQETLGYDFEVKASFEDW